MFVADFVAGAAEAGFADGLAAAADLPGATGLPGAISFNDAAGLAGAGFPSSNLGKLLLGKLISTKSYELVCPHCLRKKDEGDRYLTHFRPPSEHKQLRIFAKTA